MWCSFFPDSCWASELTLINNHFKGEGCNWHFNRGSVAAVCGHFRRKTRLRIKECWEKTFKSSHDVKFVIVFQFFKDSMVKKFKTCTWRDNILSCHNREAQIDNRQNSELVETQRNIMGDKLRVIVWFDPAVARLTYLWPSWPHDAPVQYVNMSCIYSPPRWLLIDSASTLQNQSKHNWPMTRSMGFKPCLLQTEVCYWVVIEMAR